MSIYSGIPLTTLTAWLSEAQVAYHDLQSGKQVVNLAQPNGRRIAFTPADADKLRIHIRELQTAVAILNGERDPRSRPAVATWTR